jgi:hypothetical protein
MVRLLMARMGGALAVVAGAAVGDFGMKYWLLARAEERDLGVPRPG